MNRTELIDAVSGDTSLTRQQSEAALDAIVYEITAGVRSGNPVRITGFGTFKLRERQARRGRNPQTGAPVRIKASKGIGFSAGVKLKADLNARGAVQKPRSIAAPAKATASRGVSKRTATKAPAKRAGASAQRAVASKAPAKRVVKKASARRAPARKATARRG